MTHLIAKMVISVKRGHLCLPFCWRVLKAHRNECFSSRDWFLLQKYLRCRFSYRENILSVSHFHKYRGNSRQRMRGYKPLLMKNSFPKFNEQG